MLAIFRRELKAYFNSMTGTIFIAVYYFFSGLYFFITLSYQIASLTTVFGSMFVIVLMLLPLLTMRLFSEERRNKTDQALLTAPVSLTSIVIGKYLAAITVLFLAMLINVVYGVVLTAFGNPDWLMIIANILGQFLLGAAVIAIGLFISSLTESQIIAAVSTLGVSLLIILIDSAASLVEYNWVSKVVEWISFNIRYDDFTYGIVSIPSVLFFISVSAIFIFLTIRKLDKRRWN